MVLQRDKQHFLNSFSMAASKKQLTNQNYEHEYEPITLDIMGVREPTAITKMVSVTNFEEDLNDN